MSHASDRRQLPSPEEIDRAQRFGAFDDRLGRIVKSAYLGFGSRDPFIVNTLNRRVQEVSDGLRTGELTPLPPPRLPENGIILGTDMRGNLAHIPLKWLNGHMLFVSNTGGGKSFAMCFWSGQVAASGTASWWTDLYKSETRRIRHVLQRRGVDVVILRPRAWRANILQAGKRDLRTHLSLVVDLLARSLDLPPRSRTLLPALLHALYTKFGNLTGRTDAWPCLFDLHTLVHERDDLNPPAREAILDRLGSCLASLTPQCAAYRFAWDPVDLADHNIVFEMRGAPETVKTILLGWCLESVFQDAVQTNHFNGPLRLVLWFEDGQRFFGQRSVSGDLSPMDESAGVIRGAGLGLVVSCQTTEGLSRSLLPNLGTKVMGRLGSFEDYRRLGADMGMSPEAVQWAQLHLQPGRFVVQVNEGEHRDPFLIQVPQIPAIPPVDDAEADQSVQALSRLRVIPAPEYANWEPWPVIRADEPLATSAGPQTPGLTGEDGDYLRVIMANPGRPSSQYAKLAGFSVRAAQDIRKRLIERGFLREHSVATGGRGRSAIVLEPTEEGIKAFNARQGG